MDFDIEKLKYLLKYTYYDIIELVDNVLSDSVTDPHYSAVTATNKIKCYIDVMKGLEKNLPYNDVKSFLLCNGFTIEEYMAFEKSRKKESEYYIGKQY